MPRNDNGKEVLVVLYVADKIRPHVVNTEPTLQPEVVSPYIYSVHRLHRSELVHGVLDGGHNWTHIRHSREHNGTHISSVRWVFAGGDFVCDFNSTRWVKSTAEQPGA